MYFFKSIRYATVNTKINFIYNSSKWQEVKKFNKAFINLLIILNQDFSLKIIDCCHCPALMVSSQTYNLIWVVNFQSHDDGHNLYRKQSSINIIAQEEQTFLLTKFFNSAIDSRNDPHNFSKIIKLSMNIPYDHQIIINSDKIRLIF